MQVKELVWQQDAKNCEWKEHDDGSVTLTIEDASVSFDNRAQAEQMIEAWAVFHRTEASSKATTQPSPNPQRTSRQLALIFQKK
jgi:hypothetical protein